MTAEVGVGGTWRDVAGIQVGVGGTWRTVSKGWVGVGGVWREFYSSGVDSDLAYGVDPGFGLRTGFRAWGVGSTHFGWLSETTVNSQTVVDLSTSIAGNNIEVRVSGTSHPQSHFTSLICSRGTFLTSAATYTASVDGTTRWAWTGTFSVFPSTGSETVTFEL